MSLNCLRVNYPISLERLAFIIITFARLNTTQRERFQKGNENIRLNRQTYTSANKSILCVNKDNYTRRHVKNKRIYFSMLNVQAHCLVYLRTCDCLVVVF